MTYHLKNFLHEFVTGPPIRKLDFKSSSFIVRPATNSWRKLFYDLQIGHVTNQILCKDSRVGKGSKFYMLEATH